MNYVASRTVYDGALFTDGSRLDKRIVEAHDRLDAVIDSPGDVSVVCSGYLIFDENLLMDTIKNAVEVMPRHYESRRCMKNQTAFTHFLDTNDAFVILQYWKEDDGQKRSLSVYSFGDKRITDKIKPIIDELVSNAQENFCETSWVFKDNKGDMIYTTLDIQHKKDFYPELYPYIDDVDKFMQGFAESDANVLILLGDPGTGKTSFIKEMIRRNKWSTRIVYDEETSKADELYINFMRSNDNALIFEDADLMLSNRVESGNKNMNKILNVADGIASSMNKKFIFTANIKNTADIDSAIIRPGRCYDIVTFRPLTPKEIGNFEEVSGVKAKHVEHNHTVSEIFNSRAAEPKSLTKVGFI